MSGKNNKAQMILLRSLIKEMMYDILKEDKKPGGSITNFGALFKLDPSAAESEAIKAMATFDGKVDKSAKEVGLSKRRFYDYLNQSRRMEKARQRIENEHENQEKIKDHKKDKEEKRDQNLEP